MGPGLSAVGVLSLALLGWSPRTVVTADREARIAAWIGEDAPELDGAECDALAHAVATAERESGVDALLLLAIVAQESRFDPAAHGRHGGIGLMQVNPRTAHAVAAEAGLAYSGRESLLDPGTNVRIGAAYLAALRDEFGGWDLALAAYSAGPTLVRKRLERGEPPPVQYARKVRARWDALRARHDEDGEDEGPAATR
jgi:soluble lytic murein transglycosylase-like protein